MYVESWQLYSPYIDASIRIMGKRLQLNSASYMFNVHERLPILPHNFTKAIKYSRIGFSISHCVMPVAEHCLMSEVGCYNLCVIVNRETYRSCMLGHGSLFWWVKGSWVTVNDPLPALKHVQFPIHLRENYSCTIFEPQRAICRKSQILLTRVHLAPRPLPLEFHRGLLISEN